ncbi:efflux RND transporter permease subunit [Bacillus sp. HMF5848]|uniref:efflux RND transporter permease subunit n=1 Tax=Bacillus sp. HMF5848 TaxID=2495421 RepID=UPI000F774B8F|nr:efflux RND transporter permease subunit [Bacillus sp. HMF5848]RSK26634.1 efflux RND transporter permease subunit [Bacillus sp. HMF5848]
MMEWVLKRSKIVMIFLLLLILIGLLTFFQLPQRDVPEIMPNVATVKTVYPGASPDEVERNVTNIIEERIEDLDGLKDMSSTSAQGFSNIVLEFEDNINKDAVFSDLQQKVSDAALQFPDQAQEPDVNTGLSPSAVASYMITTNNHAVLAQLKQEMERWEEKITAISGVEKVQVKGVTDEEIVISLNAVALKTNGIQAGQVIQAIQSEFAPNSIGKQEKNNQSYLLDLNTYQSVADIEKVIVGLNNASLPITVGQLGKVAIVPKETVDLVTYKGKPAISFTILAKKGVDIPSLQASITPVINQLSKEIPDTYSVEPFYIQSELVEDVFNNLTASFAISILAVVAIMLLGLSPAAAILVAVSIPLSILIGLIPVPYMGVDLNQISIIGMIIAIGILVDDAIVANENIQRRYLLGDRPFTGAVNGIREIRYSIITSSLMIVFSFFPLTFLSGSGGSFIRALPTGLIFTIIGSTIMALTFIPIITYWTQKRRVKKEQTKRFSGGLLHKPFLKLEAFYSEKVLKGIIKRPVIVSIVGLLACVLLASLGTKIPFEFFPAADREEVTITATFPNGTLLETTFENLQEMENTILQDETIRETAVFAGTGHPGLFTSIISNTGGNTGQLIVRVNKDISSTSDMLANWEQKLRDMYPEAVLLFERIEAGPPVGAPVAIEISGPNMAVLSDIADTLKYQFEELDETKLVTLDVGTPQPVIHYDLDRSLLTYYGISTQVVSEQLQLAHQGIPLGTFDDGVERRDLKLEVQTSFNEVDLSLMEIPVRNANTATITLDSIVTEVESSQLQQIPHKNGERTILLRAYPKNDVESNFEDKALALADDVKDSLAMDYTLVVGGETSERTDFFIEVTKLFIIVLFLIYLVIVVQFNSLSMPFLILSSVFLSTTGAILGLFFTNTPLSFLAVLGIVSLSGVSVRNSIILIEFFEQRLRDGYNIGDAIVDAGRARIRPIILTSLTSIVALLPIAINGDVLFKPLAISIVSGLMFSTALTLILVPAFYLTLRRLRPSASTVNEIE